jgi:hypothetical protein
MAKKFMFVCLGLLALAVTFHLGAQYGQAGYVDHSATGIVALDREKVLLENGEVWEAQNIGTGWTRSPDWDPPVPVSDIRFWDGTTLVTVNGQMWHVEPVVGWHNYGAPPGGAATQPSTWGSIKAQFNK